MEEITIRNNHVTLKLLDEKYFDEIIEAAQDERIWEFYIFNGADKERYLQILNAFITQMKENKRFPFIIFENSTNKILGITTVSDIEWQFRKAEIGSTWLIPETWGSVINLECKQSLLKFCFEDKNFSRIQLRTDVLNKRSQKAIEKIGAKREGILRNDLIRDNQTKRDSVYYSIIEEEWAETSKNIENLILEKLKNR